MQEIERAQEVLANDPDIIGDRCEAQRTIPALQFTQIGQELPMPPRVQGSAAGREELLEEILGGRYAFGHARCAPSPRGERAPQSRCGPLSPSPLLLIDMEDRDRRRGDAGDT